MCPPLGHSSVRIGPALLMRRHEAVRRWSRQRAVGRRLRMGPWEYREVGNIKESLSRVAACTQQLQAAARRSARRRCVCETMARVRQGRPCLSFLAVHPQPYATFATLRIASAQATSVPCHCESHFRARPRLGNPLARLLFTIRVVISQST